MPKKSARNLRDSRIGKRIHEAARAPSADVIVKQFRSIHVNVKTAKRWLHVKKCLELVTDDALATYLLDLAEPIVRRDGKCASPGDWKTDQDKENDLEIVKADDKELFNGEEPLRRSPRKQLPVAPEAAEPAAEVAKSVQPPQPQVSANEVPEPHEKRRSRVKHHKTKGKHHRDKRSKRKHSKNSEDKSSAESNGERAILPRVDDKKEDTETILKQHNILVSSVPKLVVDRLAIVEESVKSEKRETAEKTAKPCSTEAVEDPNKASNEANDRDEENSSKNDQTLSASKETPNLDSNYNFEASTATNDNYGDEAAAGKELEDNFPDKSADVTEDRKLEAEIQSVEAQMKRIIDEKKTKKKRKHPKPDLPVENEVPMESPAEETVHKRHKKKHKYPTLHKKRRYHDGRKAPQDGRAAGLEDLETPELDIILPEPATATNVVTPEAETAAEPQRLAIRIKLCSDCHDRHVEDACPLNSAEYVVDDAVSYKDWLNAHRGNADVTKAVGSEDPMSEGYAVCNDDAEESDEESAPGEQYKSKTKAEGEEKQLHVNEDRPLYSRESLPDCFELKITTPEHGLGVYARHCLPMYAKLGPLVGCPVKEMDIPDDFPMRHIWEVDDNGKTSYISTTNPLKSNWIRYMRPADTKDERTVAVVTNHGELHLVTTQNITAGMELTYWADSQSSTWTRKNKTDKTNCGGCNLNFTHPIYYRLHCCIFHDTNYSLTIRKYHCKICGDAVLGKDNIMKHAADLHGGRGAYQCQYCRKFFLRLNYLEMHRTYGCSQNPQRSRPLCDFCGRKFCQPQKLKVHIKRMHSDMSEVLREFQCKLCLKLLGSRAALQRHMKEVHHKDVVAAATCDRCGKMFQNKSNLKIHMLTHSGVKPFKCKEKDCKAAFTTKQCLQFHYKKVHGLTEEKMPKIERSVAYTFDAYSGGLVEDIGRGQTPRSGRRGSQHDNSNSVMSLDDCSSEHSSRADASVSSFQATINEFENDVVSTSRGNLDHEAQDREAQDHELRDHDVQDHELQNRDLLDHEVQNRDLQDHEMQNRDLQDHEMQNRELQDHEMQNRELQDHELQNRDLHDHELQNRDLHDHVLQNRDLHDHELQNRDLHGRQLQNRDLRDHELQARDLHDHELQNRDLRDREMQNPDLQDHEMQSRELHDHEMQSRELHDHAMQNREMQSRELHDHDLQNRDMQDHQLQNREMQDHQLQSREMHDHQLQSHEMQDHELQNHELQSREMQDHELQSHDPRDCDGQKTPPPPPHQEIQIPSSSVSPLETLRPSPEVDFYGMSRLQSKGSKKWMGEFNPPAEPKIVQQHSVGSSRDVYEFDENPKKDDGRGDAVTASLINGSKLGLNIYRRPESTNASLLVEAALDAAERDIGAVSSPMLDDTDRDGNLYSISSQLQSPLPSRSSESHLESYIQQQDDLMSPSATPDGRKSPTGHAQIDYHLHRPVDYMSSPRAHNIEQYLPQDELPRVSSPGGYIHIPQEELTSPSATPNPPRYQGVHHHHHHHHHQVPTDNLSSDEGDSVAQNLSLSVKEKSLQLDLSTSYKYDTLDAEFCRERGNFEPLVLNSGELQGLDMSARGFHHGLGAQLPNSRYHHHLYEITERQSVDLSRTSGYSISPPPPPYPHGEVLRIVSLDLTPSHSVDLSLSRSHHLHGAAPRVIGNERVQLVGGTSQTPGSSNSHVVPDTLEGRILSPPPPSIPGYNATYPVSPAAYHPPRPGYHHYSGYY